MSRARGPGACVLLFFLSFFLLLSSGRIASLDAGHQLQAAVMLALTGRLGDDGQPGGPANDAWVRAPNGRRYQAHDIGNIALMLPSAWVGSRLSPAPPAEDMRNPPALSRVLVSLSIAGMAALGCYWLFRLFSFYGETRTAFLLALAFPCTTIFIAYARAAWDVLPAAALMCGALYYSAALLRGVAPARSALLLAATLAGACSFRFSLAPFIVPAACGVAFSAWRHLNVRTALAGALLFTVLMLPSFAYNAVRTGSALRPATASAQYLGGNNALTGSMPRGLAGLFVSPNRGLFLFSPVLLLALAVPLVWRRLAADQRLLLGWYAAGALAYTLLISRMANWGAFGWGPRYLVPILPILFTAAAFALTRLSRPMKPVAVAAIAVSALLSLPPAVVNWHLATTSFPGAADPNAPRPYQQMAGWRALAWGVSGRGLPVAPDVARDAVRATTGMFPDLLLARLASQSGAGLLLALAVFACGAGVAGVCAARLLRRHESAPWPAGPPAGSHHG